jgi:hypothetical protein
MSEDRHWREVPADAPSLEEVVGHDAVARARRKVREVYEHYEEMARQPVPTSEGDTEADPEALTDPGWNWRRRPDQSESSPSSE